MHTNDTRAVSGDWQMDDKDIDSSSRSSISQDSISKVSIASSSTQSTNLISPPSPSIRLLFSYISTRHCLLYLVPAIIASVVSGGIAPFMTFLVGQVFDTFAQFPLTSNPPEEFKHALLRDIGISSLQLVGLGIGSFVLSSITSSLWIWTGEHNLRGLREHVYHAVSQKDMEWFDTQVGGGDAEDTVGPAGLMSKFARETDEVRSASSLASGMLVQYLTTCITCLVLAFQRSWALTLVILLAVPLLSSIQVVSQIFAGPLLVVDRQQSATAATLVDRAVSAITTVKSFNAHGFEQGLLSKSLDTLRSTTKKLNSVWAFTSGLSQFVMMAMFVQGFWFGSKLVRDGKINPGDVMAVFWACLIATSNFQMCIPQLITLNKGKFAMVSLLTLAGPSIKRKALRKIVPRRCLGEFGIENVTFSYPSRPTVPVLRDVSVFLPAHETTFIVGGSGSGKSTLSQLLLHMYEPTSGQLLFEDNPLNLIDEDWIRLHVASVTQDCILFDMTVHDNVAMGLVGSGRTPGDASRDEVVAACRAALMHDFIRDLPDGYDTKLGLCGSNLSGGQRQRLAIARAQLRNPTVLVLDEATSALDPTSRVLVFEAIKQWRRGKTTVVITHDLSQITSYDFIYVLKDGSLVEQGYRDDLESAHGEFRRMADAQATTGGCLPEKDVDTSVPLTSGELLQPVSRSHTPHFSFIDVPRPTTFVRPGSWMLDVVDDLTRPYTSRPSSRMSHREGWEPLDGESHPTTQSRLARPSSIQIPSLSLPAEAQVSSPSRRLSLQFTPSSPAISLPRTSLPFDTFSEKEVVDTSSPQSPRRRIEKPRIQWTQEQPIALDSLTQEKSGELSELSPSPSPSLWHLLLEVYPTIPRKPTLIFGLFICLCSGAMTPVFSFLLSRLMFEVSVGVPDTSIINVFGGIVLGMAALDGLFLGVKYFTMETVAMSWITQARKVAFSRVLSQEKQWFDRSDSAPVNIVQTLIKDGDDARNLLAVVLGQFFVVFAMLGVGLIWALTQGWQLTLVGLGIAPIFAGTMALQARLVSTTELRNKEARERVTKCYYNTISNIRGIRSMTFDRIFEEQFQAAADDALKVASSGGKREGISFGFASGLIYMSEALLFYIGAILIANGTYTYLQMVQTLNLLLFTVTIGSQLLAFTNRIPKAVHATNALNQLLRLPSFGKESYGVLRPSSMSHVVFHDVHFAYPERPDVPVLAGVSFDVRDECVAIVGASGSGKSTLAALLQRFYEPDQGMVSAGCNDVRSIQVNYLRDCIGVVSQDPHLFDASVRDNIAYGNQALSDEDVERAATAANLHDFVKELPNGYSTLVGENAALISGGQAQRIAIARALARPSNILILDECTSALDAQTQVGVLDTIRGAKAGRATFIVTHKLPVMQMCDRILVMENGRVVEQGSYASLIRQHGVFASLASSGEWQQ